MTGNICRCSNYNRYVEAVLAATAKKNGAASKSNSGRSTATAKTSAEIRATNGRRNPAISTTGAGGAR
jgi:xanthine dehydrogenase iron-sulfur cluster and FAD-binding subunit A